MNYGSSKKKVDEIDESKLGFKCNLGKKEAMARIILEEIRDFCNIDWDELTSEGTPVHTDNERMQARNKFANKLRRCGKMLDEDPLGQKVTKHYGTIINASTDASIGTIPKMKLTQADYDLAELHGIDPDEALAYRVEEEQRKKLESAKNWEGKLNKGLQYSAEGLWLTKDPAGFAASKLNNIPPPDDDDSVVCSTCGEPGHYMSEYNRHYCKICRKYLPKESTIPAPSDEVVGPSLSDDDIF